MFELQIPNDLNWLNKSYHTDYSISHSILSIFLFTLGKVKKKNKTKKKKIDSTVIKRDKEECEGDFKTAATLNHYWPFVFSQVFISSINCFEFLALIPTMSTCKFDEIETCYFRILLMYDCYLISIYSTPNFSWNSICSFSLSCSCLLKKKKSFFLPFKCRFVEMWLLQDWTKVRLMMLVYTLIYYIKIC